MQDRLGRHISNPSNHHTIRLGDGGHDIPNNIMAVEQNTHDMIHCTLDPWGKCHSRGIRSYNKLMNGKYIVSPDAIQVLHDLQRRYFENLDKLPLEVQKMHKIVMIDLVQVMGDKRKNLTNRKRQDDRSTFNEWHEVYMDIEKNITKKIERALKTMKWI